MQIRKLKSINKISGWENQSVICRNNDGFEDCFEIGIEYLCVEDGNGEWIGVMDMNGEFETVERLKFEKVEIDLLDL